MSIDTTRDPTSIATLPSVFEGESLSELDWVTLKDQVGRKRNGRVVRELFGPSAKAGRAYRWGIAVSAGAECSDLVDVLSRLACGSKQSKKRARSTDLETSVESWIEAVTDGAPLRPYDGACAVLWAASLPQLITRIDRTHWLRLLATLLELHQAILQQSERSSPLHLLIGGELGLTLATYLREVPVCKRLRKSSSEAVCQWCDADAESISRAVVSGVNGRLLLASLIRTKWLLAAGGSTRLNKKQWKEMGKCLATWVAAMTVSGGGSALSLADRLGVADDRVVDGLMDQAAKFDSESLKPALAAALGATPNGGRLAWQVSLPESMHHDRDAKIAVLFPDWDVRRGRMHVDYSQPETVIEVFAGRAPILSGPWETLLEINGHPQQSCGEWEEVCEYTDDDVHYLEIEQAWTGGLLLQRQIMLVRDDRTVLLADAVLPSSSESPQRSIRYTCRIPLAKGVKANAEEETREVILSAGGRRAMALPLAANEWRVGATSSTLGATEDRHLTMMVQGNSRLYAPLWLDLLQRRFHRKRTWRQLTVGDQLRIVGNDEAVGYRIQEGSEQWMIYRSLADKRCRTVLGKHMVADFYCSRFDSGDGSHDELITVDDSESSDD